MTEDLPQQPINPYGATKLAVEKRLRELAGSHGLSFAAFRYFNAAGASPDAAIGEDHEPESHLIPRALMAVTGEVPALTVFGNDYPTPDGTCIRDYIHVLDLAQAHADALTHLRKGGPSTACNLGTGTGVSVLQMLKLVEEVTGKPVPFSFGPRREGDPPELVADPSKAKAVLGWEAQWKDPRRMVESAWRWLSGPRGGRYPR